MTTPAGVVPVSPLDGIDAALAERLLAAALGSGADYADLYFEHRTGADFALEDGRAGIRAAKRAGLRCAVVGPIPAHLAMDADALLPTLVGQTAASIDALTSGERTADR